MALQQELLRELGDIDIGVGTLQPTFFPSTGTIGFFGVGNG
jgi:hypothetical protein